MREVGGQVTPYKMKVRRKMNFSVTQKKQEELEVRMAGLGVREEDLREKYVRSSGPGGQKVNKTDSCVYLKLHPLRKSVPDYSGNQSFILVTA